MKKILMFIVLSFFISTQASSKENKLEATKESGKPNLDSVKAKAASSEIKSTDKSSQNLEMKQEQEDESELEVSSEEKGAAAIESGKDLVNMDFPELTDIKDIIKAMALWTGKNVILDRNVTGKIQIISPKKVTKEEAYQAFLSALNMLQLTTVETGKVIKIMKVRNAVKDNLKTYQGASWAPRTDEIITQIIPLKYIDAKKIQSTLSRMVSL